MYSDLYTTQLFLITCPKTKPNDILMLTLNLIISNPHPNFAPILIPTLHLTVIPTHPTPNHILTPKFLP